MNKIFLSLAVLSVGMALGACSGDDEGGSGGTRAQAIAACKKYCNKLVECTPEASVNCDSLCDSTVPTNVSSSNCDVGAMSSKVDQCVAGACEDMEACGDELDAMCPGGDGPSGTGGGGNGTGGSGGGTDCAVCDDAATCCQALAAETGEDPSSCDGLSAADCSSSGAEAQFIQGCNAILQSGAALGIAACQ
jgi:hypothetical protein